MDHRLTIKLNTLLKDVLCENLKLFVLPLLDFVQRDKMWNTVGIGNKDLQSKIRINFVYNKGL